MYLERNTPLRLTRTVAEDAQEAPNTAPTRRGEGARTNKPRTTKPLRKGRYRLPRIRRGSLAKVFIEAFLYSPSRLYLRLNFL
jgi:hypothetical protein